MSIAEHEPDKLYARNKGMAKMSKSDLHDFASTSEKGLPQSADSLNSSPTKGRFHRKGRGGGLNNLPSTGSDRGVQD